MRCFILFIAALFVLICSLPVRACGPVFPYSPLQAGDAGVLRAPRIHFVNEMIRAGSGGDKVRDVLEPDFFMNEMDNSGRVDVVEFSEALSSAGLPAEREEQLMDEYVRARLTIYLPEHGADYIEQLAELTSWAAQRYKQPDATDLKQFYGYLLGSLYYHLGESESAAVQWLRVLDLPKQERGDRTLWVLFMLGRLQEKENPAEALQYYRRVEDLAENGTQDPLGLSMAAIGRFARLLLQDNQIVPALKGYISIADYESLLLVFTDIVNNGETAPTFLQQMAADAEVRSMFTIFLLSRENTYPRLLAGQWLDAVRQAGIRKLDDAVRFSWLAYKSGQFESAKKWLEMTDVGSVVVTRLRIKLLLHEGKVETAVKQLAGLIRRLPEDIRNREEEFEQSTVARPRTIEDVMLGELGSLYLSRSLYIRALEVLLRGGYWEDASYIAERVLTIEELQDFVAEYTAADYPDGPEFGSELRYLLGRRLVRSNMADKAVCWFDDKELGMLVDSYAKQLAAGRDTGNSRHERSAELVKTAKTARWNGMDIMATEAAPDWHVYSGAYEPESTPADRRDIDSSALTGITVDEQERIDRHGPQPFIRYHYRYTAADLAWEAAGLMEDNTGELAGLLCDAGFWLKNDDPQAANRFYRALVLRCPDTRLGLEARQRRWFPAGCTALPAEP